MTQAISRHIETASERQRRLVIAWEIAPGAALLPEFSVQAPLRLEIEALLGSGHAQSRVPPPSARLVQGDRSRSLTIPAAQGVCFTDAETGLTHLDVPGILHVSLRADDAARPLYARTPLLAELGIPGGRYEILSASLTP